MRLRGERRAGCSAPHLLNANKTVSSNTRVVNLNSPNLADNAVDVNNLLGIAFDPISNPNGAIHLYLAYADNNTAPFNGKIARAVSTNGGVSYTVDEDFIVGLPRSSIDHQTNGLEFGPDGCLYIAQGGNSNAGYDVDFAESRLSSAILRACFKNADGTVNLSFDRNCGGGNTQESCGVEVYASGLRNPYDLVWHSNGFLYGTDNDANDGFRDTCVGVANTFGCPCQELSVDPHGDELNLIEQGKYYGSPNPYRAHPSGLQCQGGSQGGDACSVAGGSCPGGGTCSNLSSLCTGSLCGNTLQCLYFGPGDFPTAGQDPNAIYRPPIAQRTDSGLLDGIAEYRPRFASLLPGSFCSDWDRDLLITSIGPPLYRYRLSSNGQSATDQGVVSPAGAGGLDVAVGADGTVYFATLGDGSVTFLKPIPQTNPSAPNFFISCAPRQTCVNGSCLPVCVGDCNLDNAVTIDELIKGVNIALSNMLVSQCWVMDADRNGEVTVNEIIRAVNNALNGCPVGGSFAASGGPSSRAADRGGALATLTTITQQIGSASGARGTDVTIPVSVTGGGGTVSGTQLDVLYRSDVLTNPRCSKDARLTEHSLSTSLPSSPPPPAGRTRLRTLVVDLSTASTFSDGRTFTCTFTIKSTSPTGSFPVTGERQHVSDAAGNEPASAVTNGWVTVF